MTYAIGDIFKNDSEYSARAKWANENNATISFYEDRLEEVTKKRQVEKKDPERCTYYEEESYTEKELVRYYQLVSLPTPTLDELKEKKRAEINSAREQARSDEGAEFDDDIFDVDETSQSNILAQIKVAELLQDTEATYIYRSKTNKDHLLTVSELQQLGLKIAQKVNEIYSKSWDLKEKVDKATTAEEVEAIKWTSA